MYHNNIIDRHQAVYIIDQYSSMYRRTFIDWRIERLSCNESICPPGSDGE